MITVHAEHALPTFGRFASDEGLRRIRTGAHKPRLALDRIRKSGATKHWVTRGGLGHTEVDHGTHWAQERSGVNSHKQLVLHIQPSVSLVDTGSHRDQHPRLAHIVGKDGVEHPMLPRHQRFRNSDFGSSMPP